VEGLLTAKVTDRWSIEKARQCNWLGVPTISRLLTIIGLFCRISSLLWGSFAKETYDLKEPTNRSALAIPAVMVSFSLSLTLPLSLSLSIYIHIIYTYIPTYTSIYMYVYVSLSLSLSFSLYVYMRVHILLL
jgi:hypothetical protein